MFMQSAPGVFRGDLSFYTRDDSLIPRLPAMDSDATPVHIIVGAYDLTCTPEDAERTARAIPGATLAIMDEPSHFPMSEHPEGFRPFFVEALKKMPGVAAGGPEIMIQPCIVCVAITGSLPLRANNPAVPITVSEQVESTHEAFEAGATIVHAHVRQEDETPTSDPEKFAALKEGIEKHCPGMIIQFSTGGRSVAGRTRGGMLPLAPDMASLSVGSNNFPARVYENPPDLVERLASGMLAYDIKPEIEAFDLSHLLKARDMADRGRQLAGTPYIQFATSLTSLPRVSLLCRHGRHP